MALILPKHVKTREPKDEHCVSQCTLTCNTLPLDNSKTYSHPALLSITKESIPIPFSTTDSVCYTHNFCQL